MSKLTISLTPRYRLTIQLVKRRNTLAAEPLFPSIAQLRRTRNGNKISRFFRHVFEHSKIHHIFATPMALMVLASSFVPSVDSYEGEPENMVLSSNVQSFTTLSDIRFPVDSVKVTQGYQFFHPGVDFDGVTGDPVYPMTTGTVSEVSRSRYGYGNAVIVAHEGGISTLYAHLSSIDVSDGQHVTSTTEIGKMGATGRAFGDHLHFEVRDETGRAINPMSILSK